VLVAGDIDRGGLLASLYGTRALLDPPDRALLRAFAVNKFRGDHDVLSPPDMQAPGFAARRNRMVEALADGVTEHLDLPMLLDLARSATPG
jgi:cobyric acid synthase